MVITPHDGDRSTDAIYDAVESAIREGWTPEQFRTAAGEAWEATLKEKAAAAREVLK